MVSVKSIALKRVLLISEVTGGNFSSRLLCRLVLLYLSRKGPTSKEAVILYNSAKAIKARTIVELGVEAGTSTRALLIACFELNAHLWSIDVAPCTLTRRRVEALSLSKYWTFTQQDDLEFVNSWNKPIDLLFIDTSHQYEHTKQELLRYSPFVVRGGRIYLHDSLSERYPGVARALSYFLKNHSGYKRYEHHTQNGLAELIKVE